MIPFGCGSAALYYLRSNSLNFVKQKSFFKSNYYAGVNQESCSGCETCVDRCQVHAIQMEDDQASVMKEKCIGCGLCISSCPTGALSLVHKRPEEAPPIFLDSMALIQTIAKEKNKPFPFD